MKEKKFKIPPQKSVAFSPGGQGKPGFPVFLGCSCHPIKTFILTVSLIILCCVPVISSPFSSSHWPFHNAQYCAPVIYWRRGETRHCTLRGSQPELASLGEKKRKNWPIRWGYRHDTALLWLVGRVSGGGQGKPLGPWLHTNQIKASLSTSPKKQIARN